MHRKAIPTRYAGVQFRSRLEARWAAMFDLCGIKWAYEPIDYPGWIPDFILGGDAAVIEVKPLDRVMDPAMPGIESDYVRSGCRLPLIILGSSPAALFRLRHQPETEYLGWKLEDDDKWVEAGNLTQWKGVAAVTEAAPVPDAPKYKPGRASDYFRRKGPD